MIYTDKYNKGFCKTIYIFFAKIYNPYRFMISD